MGKMKRNILFDGEKWRKENFIHAFHMPMFFFVSGFFFKRKDISLIDSMFNKSFTVADGWIKYIGKNSITFVCLNQIVIMAWKKLFAKLPSVNKLIICFAILIFSIASLMFMDHIIRKTGLKVAIGK